MMNKLKDRKYLFAMICCLILGGMPKNLKAQTLEYASVIHVGMVEDTVPVGEVWKVTAYWQTITNTSRYTQTSCSSPGYHHPFYINNNYYYKFDGSPGTGLSSTYTAVGNQFPLWLPAGTRVRTICSGDFLSIMRFTEVP